MQSLSNVLEGSYQDGEIERGMRLIWEGGETNLYSLLVGKPEGKETASKT